jgi:hypothetical protein
MIGKTWIKHLLSQVRSLKTDFYKLELVKYSKFETILFKTPANKNLILKP